MIKPQTLKGFRDFLPEEKRKRDFVQKKVIAVFERFGFEPLQTPLLEYADLILGKYGEEADKLVYCFTDRGGRKVALPYDQTVPTARVLSQYRNQLPKYFRRYQIQSVFRADKPQKGRYREFTQCDIDIFGSTNPISDAEIVACTYFSFKAIGYPTIMLKMNDRQTLFEKLKPFKTSTITLFSIIQSIDKLNKIPVDKVTEELISKGLQKEIAQKAIQEIQTAQKTIHLDTITKNIIALGVPKDAIKYEPTLARGLDYYTGMIFEVMIPEYPVGSFGGGGRYDNLIKQLGGVDIPAVGIAFGFDRMVEAACDLNLIPQDRGGTIVLVTIFNEKTKEQSLKVANILRENGINTEVYPEFDIKLDKQIKYADKKGILFVAIIGPDEVKKKMVTLKNLREGTQEVVTYEKIPALCSQST